NWPRTLLWCAYSHRRPAHRSRSLTIQLNVRQRQVDALPSALQILREAFGILELLKNFRKSKSPLGKISLKARHASRNADPICYPRRGDAPTFGSLFWGPPAQTTIQNSLRRGDGQESPLANEEAGRGVRRAGAQRRGRRVLRHGRRQAIRLTT